MALFGFAPATIKPIALVLNVLVSVVVSLRFYRAGYFSWRLLLPFAVSWVPAALLGAYITLPAVVFNLLLGALLLVAAVPFIFGRDSAAHAVSPPRLPLALFSGACVGFLSGLTGVGGGVLITPLLLYRRWAAPKPAAAISRSVHPHQLYGGASRSSWRGPQLSSRPSALCARRSLWRCRLAVGPAFIFLRRPSIAFWAFYSSPASSSSTPKSLTQAL